jgi:restriction system protein
VKEVRELYGIVAGERADRGVFVTCGAYTQDAQAFAEGKPFDLVDGPALLELMREVQQGPVPVTSKPAVRVEPSLPAPPSCPRCGASMVLRTARQGANAGGQFWGCSTYPKCRGTAYAG